MMESNPLQSVFDQGVHIGRILGMMEGKMDRINAFLYPDIQACSFNSWPRYDAPCIPVLEEIVKRVIYR